MKAKKLLAVLVVLTLVIALAVPAFAADPVTTKGTITVKNVGNDTAINVYQIITFDKDGNAYQNVQFAAGTKAVFISELNKVLNTKLPDNASDNAVLSALGDTSAQTAAFAASLAKALKGVVTGTIATKTATDVATDGSYSFTLPYGFYLLEDATVGYEAGATVNLMLTPNDSNQEVVLKTTAYTTPVKTQDKNATGSVSVGQTISYTITEKVPNFSKYTTAAFSIVDTMSKGLTYNDNAVVKLDGDVITPESISSATDATTGKTTLTIGWTDITSTFKNDIGKTITITYTATVNTDATSDGLQNKVVAHENSNTLTGETVTTHTYGFSAVKQNEDGDNLAGVEFKLYAGSVSENPTYYKFTQKNGIYVYDPANTEATETITTDANGAFTVYGLAKGTYQLVETKALTGYNLPTAPYEVVINGGNNILDFGTIVNYTGVQLPSTGGMGNTLFTITGCAILAASAAYVVINRKKITDK